MRSVEEWIGKNDDTQIPPRVRLRVFDRTDGRCAVPWCARKLQPGRWQCDHIVALINGGENRESNLQAICEFCHGDKTKADVGTKSKNNRVRQRHLGIRKPSRMAGSRNSKFKKKLDGTVVLRNIISAG